MSSPLYRTEDYYWLSEATFDQLLRQLVRDGYRVLGPRAAEAAIVYDEISCIDDLARGYHDDQQPGEYRLTATGDQSFFKYAVGPHSWKQFLFPAHDVVSTAKKANNAWTFHSAQLPSQKLALIGVRACELAAIAIQDRIFLGDQYVDERYATRRNNCLIIAVNCTTASQQCFCKSMDTGPICRSGFDIAITEIADGFVVQLGSEQGIALAAQLQLPVASMQQVDSSRIASSNASVQQKTINTNGIRDTLLGNLEHPRWDDVAQRCLSCANCTMVCPTCFCNTVTDLSDLATERVDRARQWDSCFNFEFAHVAGGNTRPTTKTRYRQWLTHKFASWIDQFETSGCVGCGRCITWCPVGIDVTEEITAIQNSDLRQTPLS